MKGAIRANPGGIIEDLLENQERQVIFFWDEVPYMLDNMSEKQPEEAMELLDTLRKLRQTYPNVRMAFTGSIGLHHIVKKLQQQGYSNDPTNDMYPIDIPPLSLNHGTDLAVRLIRGENIQTDNITNIAEEIANAVGCIPFYIHHLVNDLRFKNVVNQDVVTEAIQDSLINPQNPWKMEHYRDRIHNYYEQEQHKYALNILDILATESYLSFDELWNRLALDSASQNQETARDVLRLLLKDYYLIQQGKTYGFRYQIVKSYWELLRT
jgi:hypothetical protein